MFIRGVAVFVFALICTIFEIVLFFLLRFFDDCPHICLRDEFIIRSETEGCVQGICQFHAFVGRNVAAVFGQQSYIHFPECLQNFAASEFFSKLLFQQAVHQKADVTGQKVCFYAVFPSYKNRSCFEFCFYDPEVFFDLPAASVNYIYLDELFNEKAV